jgi:hypothetical protein
MFIVKRNNQFKLVHSIWLNTSVSTSVVLLLLVQKKNQEKDTHGKLTTPQFRKLKIRNSFRHYMTELKQSNFLSPAFCRRACSPAPFNVSFPDGLRNMRITLPLTIIPVFIMECAIPAGLNGLLWRVEVIASQVTSFPNSGLGKPCLSNSGLTDRNFKELNLQHPARAFYSNTTADFNNCQYHTGIIFYKVLIICSKKL